MVGYLEFGTPVSFGWGLFDLLDDLIPEGRIVIITGQGSAERSGLMERLSPGIRDRSEILTGVESNPSSSTVERGAKEIEDQGPDLIMALGGGSVMDAAKFMALIARHGGNVSDYLRGDVPKTGGFPVYAVPTTPGTSSEITPFSVVSVESRKNKVGLRNPVIYPKGAIIDPELTVSLPKRQTAATGLDILSHAVESYWSVRSDPVTREMSLKAVELVNEHLRGAYDDGSSRLHREGISRASVFAGLAFSNTGTTICHSISYPITFDSDLPHGMAVALTLGPVYDMLLDRGVEGLDRLASSMGAESLSFSDAISDLLDYLEAPRSLKDAGFHGGVERILSTDLSPLMRNMPVPVDEDDIVSIVGSILDNKE